MKSNSTPGRGRWAVLGPRARSAAGCLLVASAAMVAGTVPAQAASYRYWSYWWTADGAWTFATAGPSSSVPGDGSVEGWHFGVTSVAGTATDAPRVDPLDAFAGACGSVAPAPGTKRVALVIDPGVPADAPDGQLPGEPRLACAQVPMEATGYQALRSVAAVRTEDGLLCGIDGYPLTGCADVVADQARATAPPAPDPPATLDQGTASQASGPPPSSSVGPMPLILGGLAIGAMLGFIWRRRRSP
ncbi:MAG: hypothetical protein KGP12_02075 [Actinomycetales bacterium]|nr:hypothetical protein [Actinomycetales bacterium]